MLRAMPPEAPAVEAAAVETPAVEAPSAVRRFLDALERRDFEALRSCLADDVWFRALLPRKTVEATTGDETAAIYAKWFGPLTHYRWIDSEHRSLSGRELLSYRWHLRSDAASAGWHVAEQVGYCKLHNDRIRRLDIVCTGVHPL